jgi:hypothetical protein
MHGPGKPSSTAGRCHIDSLSRAKILHVPPFEGCSSCPIEGFAGRRCGFTLTASTVLRGINNSYGCRFASS